MLSKKMFGTSIARECISAVAVFSVVLFFPLPVRRFRTGNAMASRRSGGQTKPS